MKRYIDANLLIQDIEQSRKDNNHNNAIASQTHNAEHRHFIKMVLDQPDADVVKVVHSKWNEDLIGFCNVCMECGLIIDRTCIKNNSGKLNLCPNCGAKMDLE